MVFLRIAGVYNDHCHSIPIAQQIKRIYEKQLHRPYVFRRHHARSRPSCIWRIWSRPWCLPLNIARNFRRSPRCSSANRKRSATMSYNAPSAAQLHGKEWKTYRIPKALAKFGAWLLNVLPGPDPFIKPWMIDLADDHYALDISRARAASRLGAAPFSARHLAEDDRRAEVRPGGVV